MRPDTSQDQTELAWSLFLRQHGDKAILEGFVKSFFAPFTAIQAQAAKLLDERKIDTAEGVQLDGCGIIVGIDRAIPEAIYLPFFGYADQPAGRPYGVARYRNPGENYANSYDLPDEEFRTLIKAKIIINNSFGTIPDILKYVTTVFKVSKAEVVPTGIRSIKVRVGKKADPTDYIGVYYQKLLPVAAGITATFEFFDPEA